MNPYTDIKIGSLHIRTFGEDVDSQELMWHRDEQDRQVKVIKGTDWKFQIEDKLPVRLKEGLCINIPKQEWHRLIKGQDTLVIQIIE